jgi:hypothetical protein
MPWSVKKKRTNKHHYWVPVVWLHWRTFRGFSEPNGEFGIVLQFGRLRATSLLLCSHTSAKQVVAVSIHSFICLITLHAQWAPANLAKSNNTTTATTTGTPFKRIST